MPVTGKVLLDTSVVVTLLRGDAAVRRFVEQAAEVFLPCIVAGELFYGARQSRNERSSLAAVEKFLDEVTVLDCDVGTAREYGAIKAAY
ncbi:MAG: PIN domain-containing protein [Bacillota bacterium]